MSSVALALSLFALAPQDLPVAPASWEDVRTQGLQLGRAEGLEFVRHELILTLESRGARSAVVAAVEASGGRIAGEIPSLRALKVVLPVSEDEREACSRLGALAGVRAAELNSVGRPGAVPRPAAQAPNDPKFGGQWHLKNNGQTGGTAGADVRMLEAWDVERGDSNVVLAVLDSGIDVDHPEFAGRLLPGFDFVDEDTSLDEVLPHGSYVTGLAVANADNAFQVAGIDQHCQVLPIRVIGILATLFDFLQGLDFAVQAEVDVVNLSLVDFPAAQILKDGLANARGAGLILVACAGNRGPGDADFSWPGKSNHTLSIGWSNHRDKRALFSATGNALDFLAPGKDLRTLKLNNQADAVHFFDGCSGATPVVAGIVCLLKARYPQMTQNCVFQILRETAIDGLGKASEDVPGWDPFYGWGRIDAAAALSSRVPCTNIVRADGGPQEISVTTGGRHSLAIDAGEEYRNRFYVFLGSDEGSFPGTELANGLLLPLNTTAYSRLTFRRPSGPFFSGFQGVLDGEGKARAQVTIPPGADPALVGMTLSHAAIVYEYPLGSGAMATSNATDLTLTP